MAEKINAVQLLAEVTEALRTTPPWETHRHQTPENQAWLGRAANVIVRWDRQKAPNVEALLKQFQVPVAREANEAYNQLLVLLNLAQADLVMRAKEARLEGYLRELRAQDEVIQQSKKPEIDLPVSATLIRLFHEIREAFPELNLAPFDGHGHAVVLRSQLARAISRISDHIHFEAKPIAASDFGIHPQIQAKCGHLRDAPDALAEAVEKSFKVVRDRLRELTGR